MKGIMCVGLVFLLAFASAAGALQYSPPGFTGGRGLYRVISARTQGNMILGTSLHGLWSLVNYGPKDPLFQGDSTSAHHPDAHHYGTIHLAISYSISNYLEPSVALNLAGQADNRPTTTNRYDDTTTSGIPGLIGNEGLLALRDLELAVKAVYPSKEFGPYRMSYAVGIQPFLSLGLSRESSIFFNYKSAVDKRAADSIMVAHGFPDFPGHHHPDLGVKFLGDFAVPPAQFHLNLGYRKSGQSEDSAFVPYQIPMYDSLHIWAARPHMLDWASRFLWGTGLEVAAGPLVTFILEASGDNPMGAGVSDSTARTYYGGGLRFNTPAGVTIDLGGEGIGGKLRKGDPNWSAFLGLSVSASFLKPPKPRPQGTIAGRVRETDTDRPLPSAAVKIAELPTVKITLDSLGGFRANVPPGSFHIGAAAGDSFLSQDKTVTVQDQGSAYLDFSLKRKEFPRGILVGKITDVKTGDPIMAAVALGPDTGKAKSFTADRATGIYKGEATPGVYNATASAPDYLPLTLPVTLQDKQTTLQNFALKPKLKVGEKFVIRGVFFDRTGALLPESRVALEGVAQLLKENSTALVELSSHTDNRGRPGAKTILSQKQAENVRLYLINSYGIPAERLVSRGYGGMFPIDTNRTRAGRAANNRIEVKVLSRTDLGK
jgi:outer membrane protein OmpA-like peptidoglycan-associated protein